MVEGFCGVQTPGLPFHISLGCFSLDKEAKVVKLVNRDESEDNDGMKLPEDELSRIAGGLRELKENELIQSMPLGV